MKVAYHLHPKFELSMPFLGVFALLPALASTTRFV